MTGEAKVALRQWARALVLAASIGPMLVACSTSTVTPGTPDAGVTATLLQEVNAARASKRSCGSLVFPAAAPLKIERRLTAAADAHSQDMVDHGFMSHTGSDGSSVVDRLERHGYSWSALAENVAAGFPTPESVVAAWLGSPGHCANIMNAVYTELGTGSEGVFWTLVFARPR